MFSRANAAPINEPVSFLEPSPAKASRSSKKCPSCGVMHGRLNAICKVCACIRDAQAMIDGFTEDEATLHEAEATLQEEQRHSPCLATIVETVEESKVDSPLSCSDNDIPEAWQETMTSSVSNMSTADLTELLPVRPNAPLPKAVSQVLDRQEAVIESLVRRCQALEDQSTTHESIIAGHEKTRTRRQDIKAALKAEVSAVKTATKRQTKERSETLRKIRESVEAKLVACQSPVALDDPATRDGHAKSTSSQARLSGLSGRGPRGSPSDAGVEASRMSPRRSSPSSLSHSPPRSRSSVSRAQLGSVGPPSCPPSTQAKVRLREDMGAIGSPSQSPQKCRPTEEMGAIGQPSRASSKGRLRVEMRAPASPPRTASKGRLREEMGAVGAPSQSPSKGRPGLSSRSTPARRDGATSPRAQRDGATSPRRSTPSSSRAGGSNCRIGTSPHLNSTSPGRCSNAIHLSRSSASLHRSDSAPGPSKGPPSMARHADSTVADASFRFPFTELCAQGLAYREERTNSQNRFHWLSPPSDTAGQTSPNASTGVRQDGRNACSEHTSACVQKPAKVTATDSELTDLVTDAQCAYDAVASELPSEAPGRTAALTKPLRFGFAPPPAFAPPARSQAGALEGEVGAPARYDLAPGFRFPGHSPSSSLRSPVGCLLVSGISRFPHGAMFSCKGNSPPPIVQPMPGPRRDTMPGPRRDMHPSSNPGLNAAMFVSRSLDGFATQ